MNFAREVLQADFLDYDQNGNQIAERGTVSTTNRTITYTGFDLPSKITRSEIANGGGQITASIDLAYSPERARIKRTETVNNVKTTTWTVGGVEFIARNGTTKPTETKRYLGNVIQTRKADVYGAITTTTDVLLTDPLGSIDVLLPVNNGAIGTPTRMSFDAFGQRRTSSTTALSLWAQSTYDLTRTTRGYTGHEQLDSVALVHMNGRIYDPRTARFVQADPIISNLFDSQSHNRYSYVMNRPLSLVDPSGFAAESSCTPMPGVPCLPEVPAKPDPLPIPEPSARPAPATGCGGDWNCSSISSDHPYARPLYDSTMGNTRFMSVNSTGERTPVQTSWWDVRAHVSNWFSDLFSDLQSLPYADAQGTPEAREEIRDRLYEKSDTVSNGMIFVLAAPEAGPGMIATRLVGTAAKPGTIAVASGVGKSGPMVVARVIEKGEQIAGIINEAKSLTWSTGNEHALVKLASGIRALVSGGPGGINFSFGSITRIFGHTHPTNALPSAADAAALRQLGQAKQYVLHGGQISVVRSTH